MAAIKVKAANLHNRMAALIEERRYGQGTIQAEAAPDLVKEPDIPGDLAVILTSVTRQIDFQDIRIRQIEARIADLENAALAKSQMVQRKQEETESSKAKQEAGRAAK